MPPRQPFPRSARRLPLAAGQPARPREISHARTRRAAVAAIRAGRTCYESLTREIAKYRVTVAGSSSATVGLVSIRDSATGPARGHGRVPERAGSSMN